MLQMLPLLAPNLDLEALLSLCQANKQLKEQCLGLPDQLLQTIVQQALKLEPKMFFDSCQDPGAECLGSYCSSLAWLLGALSKRWGIMQLAARLDLQQALLAAEEDSAACYVLICAGARVTRALIRSSGSNMGPKAWANAYDQLSLSWNLPPLLHQLLMGSQELLTSTELEAVDSQLLFDLVSTSLKIRDDIVAHLLYVRPQQEAWLPEQVLELALLAAEQCSLWSLCRILSALPAAQQIGAQGYTQLLLLLFKCPYESSSREAAGLVLPHIQWGQQLVQEIKAAIRSKRSQCHRVVGCTACSLLDKAAQSAATLPLQLRIGLLEAATSAHQLAASSLLKVVSSSGDITETSDGMAAVGAGLRCWHRTCVYQSSFNQLLRQPAVQQLPLADVQQLLLQAVHSRRREGLQCLLEGLPAAQGITGEGLLQLLGEAIEYDSSPVDDSTCCSWELVDVLLTRCSRGPGELGVLGPGELQLLMVKCFNRDDDKTLRCLMKGFRAELKQLLYPAVFQLMRQAAAAKAPGCFVKLLKLVRHLEDVPLEVVKQVLPVLMGRSCSRRPLTLEAAVYGDCSSSSSCSACALLKAAAGELAAVDVWGVLMAAAREPVRYLHMQGLACLLGVDGLGEEQVEQLLMAAIEALPVPECKFEGDKKPPLLRKLEQLHGELLLNKQLPAAAVHRLMMACVGKALEGGVERLKEELELPGEGWKGELSAEEVKKLMGIAIRCNKPDWTGAFVAGGGSRECRPCLVVLAKLLPTLAAREQVEEGLRFERVEVRIKLRMPGYDSDSQQ